LELDLDSSVVVDQGTTAGAAPRSAAEASARSPATRSHAGFGLRTRWEGLVVKKSSGKKETKTEFLGRWLGRNPDLEHWQINQRWTKAGHDGEISNALFYQVRAKMGIKTEWRWVMDSEPESARAEKSELPRTDRPNDDLVEAAQDLLPQILMLYK
jgi:hypothetical protein